MNSYQDSLTRIAALQAQDDDSILPECGTRLLTHGERTARAIVLLHGYTNNPRQYRILAEQFFALGYNVLVPRFPGHGFKDRMTTALADQTEQGLLTFTNAVLDMAQGLGEQLTVLGFSMGGVLALWAAQHRSDLSQVVAISPALAFHAIPLALTPLIIQYYLHASNQFNWWDPQQQDISAPPLHAYPRYATRGLAHFVNLGLTLRADSRRTQPQAGSILIILNPTDEAVNHTYAREIACNWQRLGYPSLRLYEFDPALQLKHDLMEPDQPFQQIDVVYPLILELVTGK